MDEAETFSAKYLKEALQKIPVSSLSREVISHTFPFTHHMTFVGRIMCCYMGFNVLVSVCILICVSLFQ